ncbi:hypothetical protein PSV08DRAFT_249709 [Bipolaris maydis]|uniref:uncharacterized protein n=1 Tax=Cochliobolus heterostrophus TaxID=5016 RepID=UPI0024D4A7ED|nr:hypothetical protein J3E74DRAFT_293063 [Bipolaris maydis]KAJ6268386.1 hypothetical protein PSV08DRAFT_249709 [Bipolaris maydis]KAJ6278633.1 hypothetical protein J3E71DRAFT_243631 [Bipolaris maydis]
MTGRTFPQSSTRTIHRRPGSSRIKASQEALRDNDKTDDNTNIEQQRQEYSQQPAMPFPDSRLPHSLPRRFYSINHKVTSLFFQHSPTEERENRYREDACNTGIGDREEGDDRDSDVDDDIQVDAEEDFDTPPNTSLAHLLVVASGRSGGHRSGRDSERRSEIDWPSYDTPSRPQRYGWLYKAPESPFALSPNPFSYGSQGSPSSGARSRFPTPFQPAYPSRPIANPSLERSRRSQQRQGPSEQRSIDSFVQRTAKPSLERSLAENNPDNSFIKAGYREFISACEARAKLLRAQAEKALKDANQQELLAHQATRVLARQFPASSDDKKVDPPQPGSGGQDPV